MERAMSAAKAVSFREASFERHDNSQHSDEFAGAYFYAAWANSQSQLTTFVLLGG
jgi:hypothetical protein